ncbi:uncharacterized protein LOC114716910 [Neltuma alba]|uniref:uncharacterized protein LOC114716910 n=1 Tax=Neltuma alba TaxID=207710 RepID=UPI0010A2BBAA|nr:uncharacterized protein LOC114716910 [Prosopis alba]
MEYTDQGKFKHQIFQLNQQELRWSPPPTGVFRLDTDGSVNLQQAACGGTIRDENGNWITGFQKRLGRVPSTIAELIGITTGLQICKQQGFDKVLVYTDSLEAIHLLMIDSGGHHPFSTEITEGRRLIFSDWEIELRYAPRESIQCADFLAREAHHIVEDMKILNEPHPGCFDRLRLDRV